LFSDAAGEGRHERRELQAFAAGGCGPPAFGRSFAALVDYRRCSVSCAALRPGAATGCRP